MAKDYSDGSLGMARMQRPGPLARLLPRNVEEALAELLSSSRVPTTRRAGAELTLTLYREVKRSHGLEVSHRARRLDLTCHPRCREWMRELHEYHAAHGWLEYIETYRFYGEMAVITCEVYFGIEDIDRLGARSHLGVVLEGYERQADQTPGSAEKDMFDAIARGNGFKALTRLNHVLDTGQKAWDARNARECLQLDHASDNKIETAKLIAERVNQVLRDDLRRVHHFDVYAHFDEVLELYCEHAYGEIARRIGHRAWR